MNSEMNTAAGNSSSVIANLGTVVLDSEGIRAMRHHLHELANVFTGVMIGGGLLSQYLEGGSLQHYASDICEGSQRGCVLVRELRTQLLNACGEGKAALDGTQDGGSGGNPDCNPGNKTQE
jgi:hypothetical protein